jgi:hypothetical protein
MELFLRLESYAPCGLGFLPWHDDSASDEICPCCYIQFGYDDASEPRKVNGVSAGLKEE